MQRPAIFFDRDNTLIINDGYLGDANRTILMPGAAEAVGRARQMGFAIVTISNQSGVARGLFDEAAVEAVNHQMDKLLLAEHADARIDLHLYCPFHPDAVVAKYRRNSELRKPAPGMILLAAKLLDLNLSLSWVIGDALRDIEAGVAAGCGTILFVPPNFSPSPQAASDQSVLADHLVTDLVTAIDIVAEKSGCC